MNKIIIDFETSGLKNASVLSISLIKLDENLEIIDKVNRYYYPSKYKQYDDEAIEINRLTNLKIKELRKDEKYKYKFLDDTNFYIDYLKDVDLIISHNIKFEYKFLPFEIKEMKIKMFCTMLKNIENLKIEHEYYGYKYPTLKETTKFYQIEINESKLHDSSYDCELVYEIYKKMMNYIQN